jgi:protoporphyrinogen oxidase
MWETMADEIIANGGEVRLNSPVTKLEVRDGKIVALEAGGERIEPSEVISSLPLRATVGLSGAAATGTVQAAAQGLRYRDFLTVALVIDGMVPDQSKASIGMEYFCFKGDELWESSDEDLVEMAKGEIEKLGLAQASKVERGFVTRVPKAYPMYDADYGERVAVIKEWLAGISNIQQVGRNGLHRYNNSDHSMLTAMRAVENIMAGTKHDLWEVNAESAYHEEHQEPEQPYKRVPSTQYEREPLADREEATA